MGNHDLRRPALLLAGVLLVQPRPTDACSSSDEMTLLAPSANATRVPTDVELWLEGNVRRPGTTLTLEAADGEAVPYTLRPVDDRPYVFTSWLLRPSAPLRPGLRYVLKERFDSAPNAARTWSFETGDGPVVGAAPPIGLGATRVIDPVLRGCGESSFACVGMSYQGVLDLVVRRCDGALITHRMLVSDEDGLTLSYGGFAVQTPFCATLRARQANGALGPASTFCSDPATTSVLPGSCIVRCTRGVAMIDGRPLGVAPDDTVPEVCIARSHTPAAQWDEAVRSIRAAAATSACTPSDAGATDDAGAAGDVGTAGDASTAGAATAAGCRATPGSGRIGSPWGWIVALIGCRLRRRGRRG